MNIVKLRNGAEEAEPVILTTMMSLRSLWDSGLTGILAVYDLAEICKGGGYAPSNDTLETLKQHALLQSDGKPHGAVRNIVLSAVQGDGLDVRLSSPVAPPAQAVLRRSNGPGI